MKHASLQSIFAVIAYGFLASVSTGQSRPATQSATSTDDLLVAFGSAKFSFDQKKIAEKIVALGDKTLILKMLRFLDTPDRAQRCNVGLVLAGLGDDLGVELVIVELNDKYLPRPTELKRSDGQPWPEGQIKQDRYYAALILGQLRDKRAVPDLIETLPDQTINYRAAVSLGEIGDQRAVPALRQMIKDFPAQRLWAGYGLAALGESEGFDILSQVALSDSDWGQRRHAVEAMGIIGDHNFVPVLVKALKDNHPNVKVSAARALGKIGDSSVLPALTEALKDTQATEMNAPTTVDKEARAAIAAIEARKK